MQPSDGVTLLSFCYGDPHVVECTDLAVGMKELVFLWALQKPIDWLPYVEDDRGQLYQVWVEFDYAWQDGIDTAPDYEDIISDVVSVEAYLTSTLPYTRQIWMPELFGVGAPVRCSKTRSIEAWCVITAHVGFKPVEN